jgi:hypothetical protein
MTKQATPARRKRMKVIRVAKSRLAETTRQAAAATTYDIVRVLKEAGTDIPAPMRQLFLDAIHTSMLEAFIDLLASEHYTFEDG